MRRWIGWLGAVLGAAVAAVASGGCGPRATLPPEATEPIRVGVVTSLTGGLGSDGPGWADASELAARELNAAGGPLPGRAIEIVVRDDQTNPATAEAIATELVEQEGVVAVVGAAASSISLGLAEVTTPAQVPQISCCSTSDLLTDFNEALPEEDRYFFRTAPPDGQQSQVVARAADDLACNALAILHLDDSYGQPFGAGIEASYEALGGTVVARVPFPDEQPSYMEQLTQIRDARPDCIALVAFPVSAGRIVRDWNGLSGAPDVTWIGTDGVRVPGFVDEVGDPRLIAGFFGTSPITDALTPEFNAFREHFRTVYGRDPIPFASNQYDAMALVGLAIAWAGTTDGPAVRDALREVSSPPMDSGLARAGRLEVALAELRAGRDVDYSGASGDTDFNELGNVVTSYEIWRYDPPSEPPCPGATILSNDRGSFCRAETIHAEDLQ